MEQTKTELFNQVVDQYHRSITKLVRGAYYNVNFLEHVLHNPTHFMGDRNKKSLEMAVGSIFVSNPVSSQNYLHIFVGTSTKGFIIARLCYDPNADSKNIKLAEMLLYNLIGYKLGQVKFPDQKPLREIYRADIFYDEGRQVRANYTYSIRARDMMREKSEELFNRCISDEHLADILCRARDNTRDGVGGGG